MKIQTHFLYMVLIGCKPKGRLTEQHDIFFGIASSLHALVKPMKESWPEANGKIHIDAWRKVTHVDGYDIVIANRTEGMQQTPPHLYFVNLGGYTPDVFEEQHCKILTVAEGQAQASKQAKANIFFKQNSFKGAESHIDDKYGLDVDDIFYVQDALPLHQKELFSIQLRPSEQLKTMDETAIGYVKIADLENEHE